MLYPRIKKENSVNPFYMNSWKCKTFSHLAQFSQKLNMKLPEIGQHFQPHHFKHPEAINNQDRGTPRLDETSWFY